MPLSFIQNIRKKRDKKEFSTAEIQDIITLITEQKAPDYQVSALLMAIYLNGLSTDETVALTEAMAQSGDQYDLGKISGIKIDKHSTGGIGDKSSLIIAPLAAACGLKVPMMAGRGLGHTGGTLDKLEAIPGFQIQLNRETFEKTLQEVGCAIIGQSAMIAPADRKLYALRDVTGTIESIPLITASILSKKLAEGTQGLVLDIKVGSGAFMKTKTDATRLAKSLLRVGKKLGLKIRAVLSCMNQPLGYAVGNSLEVYECIEILKNQKTNPHQLSSIDLKELTIHLCAQMLELGKIVKSHAEGRKLAQQKLSDGSAWKVFQKMVAAQGGDLSVLEDPSYFLKAPTCFNVLSEKKGIINAIHAEGVGNLLIELGGGRNKVDDQIDHSVGFLFHKKLGATVRPGDILATVYGKSKTDIANISKKLLALYEIQTTKKAYQNLILEPSLK